MEMKNDSKESHTTKEEIFSIYMPFQFMQKHSYNHYLLDMHSISSP